MFNAVDPYTKLYIGSKKDNLEILTKGKYGGIGMQIGLVNDTLTVISCYEDSMFILKFKQVIKFYSFDTTYNRINFFRIIKYD